MDLAATVYAFMDSVREDPRIGPSHISLYLSIINSCRAQNYQMPISVFSRDLMKGAKIAATGTYHKCMRDLQDLGFIQYFPSCNPVVGSLVNLKEC